MSKKVPYKEMALDLKHRYIAKVRLLAFYKLMVTTTTAMIEVKDGPIGNLVLKSLIDAYNNTRVELRVLHLTRAFIRGVPYSKVENNPMVRTPSWEVTYTLAEYKIVSYGDCSDPAFAIYSEVRDWVMNDTPSKILAKPAPVETTELST